MAFLIRKILFWIFVEEKKKIVPNLKEMAAESKSKESTLNINPRQKCTFCNRCEDCQCEFDKEKKKKDEQKELDRNVSALNYLAFFCLFLFMFIANLYIWLKISSSD
jgi:hypothetical protein